MQDADTKQELAPVEQPKNEGAAVMEMIAKAASDTSYDVVKLEKLMDLQERVLNRNAKNAFAADFVRMKPHLPKVVRTKKNTQTNSNYAPLEDINTTIDPVLEQFGFSTAAKIIAQTDNSVTVKAELWHRDGHVEETQITMPLDKTGIAGTVNKTGPHALSSSVTYAKRVAVCALLNVSTGEDKDGNHAKASQPITTEQAVAIDLRAVELEKTSPGYRARFLKWAKVERADQILDVDHKKCLAALSAAEKETKGKKP